MDMGLEAAGMRVVWQVEIDPQARAVLRKHWPDVDLHEDVRNVGSANLAPVDLICGGFPCQDLSVAGRRAGLAGERSGLFYEFMRVVAELAPRWVLIENVPGLLSSNGGRDMGAVVGTLAKLGYGWTYRVLDLQHFGVPQRRRRVFIVGRAGGFCPPEILFEPESVPGHPAPGREAREGVAGGVEGGAFSESEPGWWRDGVGTLRAEGYDAGEDGTGRGTPLVTTSQSPTGHQGDRFIDPRDVAFTLPARGGNNGGGAAQIVAPHLVTFNAKQAAEDAAEDVSPTLRATPHDASHPNGGGQMAAYSVCPGACNKLGGREDIYVRRIDAGRTLDCTGTDPTRTQGGTLVATAIPRRLTPRECERLMGWPDDWTRYGIIDDGREVEMADGPRYRMCGNGVGAPVAEWIGRRIVATDTAARKEAT